MLVRLLPAGKSADPASLETLARQMQTLCAGRTVYVLGNPEATMPLARLLGNAAMLVNPAENGSTAILGLKRLAEEQGEMPLSLQLKPASAPKRLVEPALVEWGMRAAFLLLAVLLFPTLEAALFTTPLSEKVSTFQAKAANLETNVDQEMGFLQALKQIQPPYLESIYIISKVAPPGIHVDSLTMNRRGEMNFRGTLANGDQVADFRAKLIASGYFAGVTVEEQTPEHQKVTIRLTGQWKPLVQLQAVSVGPTPAELAASTNAPDAAPGGLSGHGPGHFPGPGGMN
jgi:hypothetical protein